MADGSLDSSRQTVAADAPPTARRFAGGSCDCSPLHRLTSAPPAFAGSIFPAAGRRCARSAATTACRRALRVAPHRGRTPASETARAPAPCCSPARCSDPPLGWVAALGHVAGRPMQPAVAGFEVEGGRTEHQQSEPLAAGFGDITQHGADGGGVVPIMLVLQEGIEARTFGVGDEADADLVEEGCFGRAVLRDVIAEMDRHATTTGQSRSMRQPIRLTTAPRSPYHHSRQPSCLRTRPILLFSPQNTGQIRLALLARVERATNGLGNRCSVL